ncbi:GTP pyrophosphokinase [Domibacillus robiginosus]|uniref:GTP pyrophosphokinase n=1 Tax=Domibacillus robiginosus TaxID=1071054 RepID=UPI00067E300B|nr:GTP pyrophosphokinase [Domibacillus robiginosus]
MNIERAITIAANSHAGQSHKGVEAFILHPLRVMMAMPNDELKTIAVLHDVIEKTNITIEDLQHEGFSEKVIIALDSLTKRENEPYMDFIRRAKKNELAKVVKIADIKDNKEVTLSPTPSEEDEEKIKKYDQALEELLS